MNTLINTRLKKYDKEIIKRYLNGESCDSIGKSLNCWGKSISRRLDKNGIEKRSISEALRGKPKSEIHKKRLSETRRKSGLAKGERNPNWKGGLQDNWSKVKNSFEYKNWRKQVFERDNYICQICEYEKGHILEPHHIMERSKYPQFQFLVDNGVTLCKYCHWKLHSRWANLKLGELLGHPTVKSGITSSRAILEKWKVQRLCTQHESEDIVWSL